MIGQGKHVWGRTVYQNMRMLWTCAYAVYHSDIHMDVCIPVLLSMKY
jgi:hypothetical protein